MENPEIPGRIQMERFIPLTFCGKEVIPFEVLPFSSFYRNDRKFLYHLSGLLVPASCREKAENLPVFCKWYNSFPFLFSVPKKYQYHLTEIFHRNFRTNGKHSLLSVLCLPKCFLQFTFVVLVVIPCNLVIRIPTKRLREYH